LHDSFSNHAGQYRPQYLNFIEGRHAKYAKKGEKQSGFKGFKILSKPPENPRLLNLGMNGCPESRPFLSARRQGPMACSGHGTEDKFAN
jgi:hypothetical protein